MHAIATTPATLTLLVPSSLLPGEGDLETLSLAPFSTGGTTELFQFFQEVARPFATPFRLSAQEVEFAGDLDEESTLNLVRISAEVNSGEVGMEVFPAMSHFDWAGVLSEVAAAVQSPHFLGTAAEQARVFTEAVREVASVAAVGFKGDAIPLLSVALDEATGAAEVTLLGVWLADEHGLAEMRRELPAQSWVEGQEVGQTTCILLKEAEVEGRGLKEMVLGASLLAMVFGGTVARAAEPAAEKPKTSRLASFLGVDTRPGEKLAVKTQKLVQDAPRIYRENLDMVGPCEVRVIVDIGAQRAYLLKDGQIAFETPISTGRGKRMTPRGTFTITEKVRKGKISTIYKCPLPGWMRLGQSAIGMHEGQLPGYAASHGCIRMPLESALLIFDHAPKGTTVQVTDSWTPALPAQAALLAQK